MVVKVAAAVAGSVAMTVVTTIKYCTTEDDGVESVEYGKVASVESTQVRRRRRKPGGCMGWGVWRE